MKPTALSSPHKVASSFLVSCKAHTAFFQEQVPWVARIVCFSNIGPLFPSPDLPGTSDSNCSLPGTKFLTRLGAKFLYHPHPPWKARHEDTGELACSAGKIISNFEFPLEWCTCTCTFHTHMWSMCFAQARCCCAQKGPGEPALSPGYFESWSHQTRLFYVLTWVFFHSDLLAHTSVSLVSWQTYHLWDQICLVLVPATVYSLLLVTVGSQSSLDRGSQEPQVLPTLSHQDGAHDAFPHFFLYAIFSP